MKRQTLHTCWKKDGQAVLANMNGMNSGMKHVIKPGISARNVALLWHLGKGMFITSTCEAKAESTMPPMLSYFVRNAIKPVMPITNSLRIDTGKPDALKGASPVWGEGHGNVPIAR